MVPTYVETLDLCQETEEWGDIQIGEHSSSLSIIGNEFTVELLGSDSMADITRVMPP